MDTFTRRLVGAACAIPLALGLALLTGCGAKSNPAAPTPLPPLSAVVLAPADTTLKVGQNASFAATALDMSAQPVAGASFAWSSSNAGVLTVTLTGVVTAVGEGTAKLYASAGGKTDSSVVHVLPATSGWYAQTSGVSNNLKGVYVLPDGRHGWAVGETGRIIATADAGVTWATQNSRTVSPLNAVWFFDASEGWAAGNGGVLLHTTDGGTTWTQQAVGASENLNAIWFATPDTGWVVGGLGAVLTTFDHGATWTKTNVSTYALRGVSFAGTRTGWAVGDNGTIVGTTDRGLTWNLVSPGVTTLHLKAVWRTSLLRANAVGAAGAAPRTTDDGFGSPAWALANPGAGYAFEGVCFVDDDHGWAVGANGTGFVLVSADGGASWTAQTAVSQYQLNHVFFVDAQHGWVVGDNGTILHTATGGVTPL